MQTYLELPCSRVSYLQDLNAMEIYWIGFASVENYQLTLDTAYEVIKMHKTPYWISDMTEAKVVKIENQKWLKEVFIPKVFALNILRKGAYVVSQDIFNKSYLMDVKKDLENNFEAQYFLQKQDALAWLRS